MRKIDLIVIHCSATKEGVEINAATIRQWHKAKGWSDIGYHYVIKPDGTMETGRPLEIPGAHVAGHNKTSIGICYVGGLDANNQPKDTRTSCQKEQLLAILRQLKQQFPEAEIVGHRDLSPDLDGDGIIEPQEWLKACPCFNAAEEYKSL